MLLIRNNDNSNYSIHYIIDYMISTNVPRGTLLLYLIYKKILFNK